MTNPQKTCPNRFAGEGHVKQVKPVKRQTGGISLPHNREGCNELHGKG